MIRKFGLSNMFFSNKLLVTIDFVTKHIQIILVYLCILFMKFYNNDQMIFFMYNFYKHL